MQPLPWKLWKIVLFLFISNHNSIYFQECTKWPGDELSWNHPTSETSQSSSTRTYVHLPTDNYLHLPNRKGMRSGRMCPGVSALYLSWFGPKYLPCVYLHKALLFAQELNLS